MLRLQIRGDFIDERKPYLSVRFFVEEGDQRFLFIPMRF